MEPNPAPPRQKFVIRKNCEYSIEIEAADEAEALEKAEHMDLEHWTQAWSPLEGD